MFETENFLLLHLQHNLYVTIDKNHLNANIDDVKTYLAERCYLVKKKKFINCKNDKIWSLVFISALSAICVAGIIAGLFLSK